MLAGFLVQLLGWCVFTLVAAIAEAVAGYHVAWWSKGPGVLLGSLLEEHGLLLSILLLLIGAFWPIAGVVYGIYRYLNWAGAGQREVAIAFAGGLLIKTFFIPFIKGIVTGALFKWFMGWLLGGNVRTSKSEESV
jgi:hypothetical protein